MIIIKQPLNFFFSWLDVNAFASEKNSPTFTFHLAFPTSLQLRAPLTKLKVAMQPIYYTNQTERRTARLNEEGNNGTANWEVLIFCSVQWSVGVKTARVNARLSSRESLLGGSFWTASTPTLRSGDMQRNIWSPAIMYTSTIKKARQASSVAVWK